eukprot:TRINITY_DN11372_c0_g1_i2.p1 TRINITY_DN11372_c0_g1~~TRINITY_DN11372_c0_g1_i2.p1  ORF type:complete len:188 (+),score=36.74 TRINITY_DN11372_c0_g1_i2:31-564(+)
MADDRWYSPRVGSDPLFTDPREFLDGVDTLGRVKMCIYFLMWLGGYISTQLYWHYASGSFFCDLLASTSSSSISFDILFCGLAVLFWVFTDFRKMGFSIYTFCIFFFLSFGAAISITVPFYLFLRVSREYKTPRQTLNDDAEPRPPLINFTPLLMYLGAVLWWFRGFTPFNRPGLCK